MAGNPFFAGTELDESMPATVVATPTNTTSAGDSSVTTAFTPAAAALAAAVPPPAPAPAPPAPAAPPVPILSGNPFFAGTELESAPAAPGDTAIPPAPPGAPEKTPGLVDDLLEAIHPSSRSGRDEALEAKPDLHSLPELRHIGADSMEAYLGTLANGSRDVVESIFRKHFPDVTFERRGAYLVATSKEDGKEYVWKPGLQPSDIENTLSGMGIAIPIGMAATLAARKFFPNWRLGTGAVGAAAGATALETLKRAAGPSLPPLGGEVSPAAIAAAAALHVAPAALGKLAGMLGEAPSAAGAGLDAVRQRVLAANTPSPMGLLQRAGQGDAAAGVQFGEGLGRDLPALRAARNIPGVLDNVTPDMLAGTSPRNQEFLRASQATKSAASKAGGAALNQEEMRMANIAQAGANLVTDYGGSLTAAAPEARIKTSLETPINAIRAVEKPGYGAIRADIGRQRFDYPATRSLFASVAPDAMPPSWKKIQEQLAGDPKFKVAAQTAAEEAVSAKAASREATARADAAIAAHEEAARLANDQYATRPMVKAAEKARDKMTAATANADRAGLAAQNAADAARTAAARAAEEAKPSFENISRTKKLVSRSAWHDNEFTGMTEGELQAASGALAADERNAALAGGHPEIDALHAQTAQRFELQKAAKRLGLAPVKAPDGSISLEGDALAKVKQGVRQLVGGRVSEFAKNMAAIPANARQMVATSALPELFGEKADQPLNFVKFHENFSAIERDSRAMNALASNLDPALVQKLKDYNVIAGKISRMVKFRSHTGETGRTTEALGGVHNFLDTLARHGAWAGGAIGGAAGFAAEGTSGAAKYGGAGYFAGGKLGGMLSSAIRGDKSAITQASDAFLASDAFQAMDFTGHTPVTLGRFANIVNSSKYQALADALKLPLAQRAPFLANALQSAAAAAKLAGKAAAVAGPTVGQRVLESDALGTAVHGPKGKLER